MTDPRNMNWDSIEVRSSPGYGYSTSDLERFKSQVPGNAKPPNGLLRSILTVLFIFGVCVICVLILNRESYMPNKTTKSTSASERELASTFKLIAEHEPSKKIDPTKLTDTYAGLVGTDIVEESLKLLSDKLKLGKIEMLDRGLSSKRMNRDSWLLSGQAQWTRDSTSGTRVVRWQAILNYFEPDDWWRINKLTFDGMDLYDRSWGL